ncbi:MAG: hydrogenase [Bacillota bacterium]|nr:hydrogenase [Bacillota bacterium]
MDYIISLILILAIIMAGFRRIKLIKIGFALQSFLIAVICFIKGYEYKEYGLFILGILTIITKVFIIPYIVKRSAVNLKKRRETELIINGYWSYIISGVSVVLTFAFLKSYSDSIFKASLVLIIVGVILLVGRKKALTQMLGLLIMENGIVLFEISLVKIGPILEVGIIFEMLVLSLIMGVMVFRINKTFNSINTDYLSNLKE